MFVSHMHVISPERWFNFGLVFVGFFFFGNERFSPRRSCEPIDCMLWSETLVLQHFFSLFFFFLLLPSPVRL